MKKQAQVSARVDEELQKAIKQSPHTVKELIRIGLDIEDKTYREAQQGMYQSELEVCEKEIIELKNKKQFLEQKMELLDEKEREEVEKKKEQYEKAVNGVSNLLRANKLKRENVGPCPKISWNRFEDEVSGYNVDVKEVYRELPSELRKEVARSTPTE